MVSFSAQMTAELARSNSSKETFDVSDLELYGLGMITLLVGVIGETRRLGIEIECKACSHNLIEIAEVSGAAGSFRYGSSCWQLDLRSPDEWG